MYAESGCGEYPYELMEEMDSFVRATSKVCQHTSRKHSFERHTVCSDVSLKPVSVAVLVVTAPVWGQPKSSRSWFRSDAQGEELFMRGGEMSSRRMTAIGGKRRKQNWNCGTEHR